jgi:hypothetical protein
MSHAATPDSNPTITYLLVNTAYHFIMDQSSLLQKSASRTPSPFENNYESYENTRENARGERLLNEYKDTTPLVVLKQVPTEDDSQTLGIIARMRMSLRVLSFCVSGSVVGVLAHFLNLYLGTKGEWVRVQERYGQRMVWPLWLKMRPTFVLFGVAATATLFSLVLLVVMFFRAVRISFNPKPLSCLPYL